MKINLLTLTTALLLIGCGGGGGGGEPTSPAPASPVAAGQPAAQRTMEDLSVPDGFSYRTELQVNLTVNADSLPAGQHTLSIYSSFSADSNEQVTPVRSSRLLTAALTDNRLETQLVLPTGTTQLLFEVWTMGNNSPQRSLITLDQQALNQDPSVADVTL